jgi:hypothetical protein
VLAPPGVVPSTLTIAGSIGPDAASPDGARVSIRLRCPSDPTGTVDRRMGNASTRLMGGGTRLWNVVTGKPARLALAGVSRERDLEGWIAADSSLIENDLLILARQLNTGGKPLDLLGLDGDGSLVVVELKRGEAYREALAQGLDYAAWVAEQTADDLRAAIDKHRNTAGFFDDALAKQIGPDQAEKWSPQEVDVRLIVAGTGADDRLRRMIGFLSKRGVNVNGVFFDVYQGPSDTTLVARTSVLSDEEVEQTQSRGRGRGTHDALMNLAKANGTDAFMQPVLDGWRAATGREPRAELYSWTLPAAQHGGRTIAKLWPGQKKPGEAWLEVHVSKLVSDSARTDAGDCFKKAGVEVRDGSWIPITNAETAKRIADAFSDAYGKTEPAKTTDGEESAPAKQIVGQA